MGLDVTVKWKKNIVCPKCGEVVGHTVKDEVDSGGRVWYPILERFGYYVPYDQRTEENDWYGKDMILTPEQVKEVHQFLKENDVYSGDEIIQLIASATFENDPVAISADW